MTNENRGYADPSISVIVPTYNSGLALIVAIESVLAQTQPDFEVIIVDDCSTEPLDPLLDEIGSDSRVRVVRQLVNSGPTAARNAGLAQARGRFVAFLDADDSWHPAKLCLQLDAVLSRPDPERVFCVTKTIINLGDGRRIVRPVRGKRPDERIDEFIFVGGNFCQTSSFFLSRALAVRIGWRELTTGEDHLFAIDAVNAGAEYLLVEEPLAIYNNEIRPGRLSHTTTLQHGRRFMDEVRNLVSAKALAGYETRYLGAQILRDTPLRGMGMVTKAVATGALPIRFAATLLARAALPPNHYHRIRATLLSKADDSQPC